MSEQQEKSQDERMIEALLHEREGYVQRNMPDRIAQVDEQIKLRGGEPPKGRRTAQRETTAQ